MMNFFSMFFSQRRVPVFVLLLFVTASISAQCDARNAAFTAGERLTYQAYYNWHFIWVNGGEVLFKTDPITYRQKPAMKLTALAKTHKKYDVLLTIRDTFIAIIDTSRLEPLWSARSVKEGSYVANEYYRFDYDKKQIVTSLKVDKKPDRNLTVPMKECTMDLLTMVYKARNIDFSKYRTSDKIPTRMIVDGVIHDLYITYLGKEIIKTKDQNQTFRCIKFKPMLMKGTLFDAGEDMTVWVTDDANRIPVMVEAKITIGSVKAILFDAKGLRHPITAEVK